MEHCVDSQAAAHFDLSLTRSFGPGRQEYLVTHLSGRHKIFNKKANHEGEYGAVNVTMGCFD